MRFGPIMQMGFVTRDLDRAMAHWTQSLGIGPFFVTRSVGFADIAYRGAASPIGMAVAMAYSGDIQIEIIQPTNDAPSIYRDHLAQYGESFQHVGVLSDTYADDLKRTEAAGIAVLQGGHIAAGLGFAYLDTAGPVPGTIVELIEATPGIRRYFDKVRAAAQGWDGRDPVRIV